MKLLLALTFIFCTGCAHPKPIVAWKFKTCQKNGDHFVCTCEHYHTEVNPKAVGGLVGICE